MKKRRDITLGEMQDECKRVECKCEKCDRRISLVCGSMINSNGYFETPNHWDLSDPPRFNEAQMAFWRGLYEIGVNFVMLADDGLLLRMATSRNADNCSAIMVIIGIQIGLEKEEELDLAELFGKERK